MLSRHFASQCITRFPLYITTMMVQGNKFEEAEDIFQHLMVDEKAPLKPDQKMFHMMIYMHKKAGNYEKARQLFSLMAERGIEQSTVTYNSLMSFETNYKEVSRIYDQVRACMWCSAFVYAFINDHFYS